MALSQTFNIDGSGNIGTAGSVTTTAPSYVTGTSAAMSLTVTGLLRVDGSNVTQPVSATTLPLPTGASTSALQTTGNSTLLTISGQLPATLGAKTIANSLAVNIASDQVVPISATALPLPTGAATAALQTSGNASLVAIAASDASIDSKTPALGQAVMAASVPVVIASNQSAIPVTLASSASATATLTSVALATSSTSVLASNAARKGFTVFNDSLNIVYLAYAATASTTAFTSKLLSGSAFTNDINFTGAISMIASAATGSLRVTELT